MRTWRDKFTFKSKKFAVATVGDREIRFYPNRMKYLDELKEVAEPLALAITTFMNDRRMDLTSTSEKQTDAQGEYVKDSFEGLSTDMAEFRDTQRRSAVSDALNGLANTRTKLVMGQLLIDSMREEFPRGSADDPKLVEEFINGSPDRYDNDDNLVEEGFDGIDLPVLVQMTRGWLKANAEVFGDKGKKVAKAVEAQLAKVADPTIPGSDSKTASSSPLAGESVSTS